MKKDKQNLIGISIGGGAPLCPCLYVVQVFDNTPASREGVLQAGDEIVGVNGKSLRGKTKVDVARAIQAVKVSSLHKKEIDISKLSVSSKLVRIALYACNIFCS